MWKRRLSGRTPTVLGVSMDPGENPRSLRSGPSRSLDGRDRRFRQAQAHAACPDNVQIIIVERIPDRLAGRKAFLVADITEPKSELSIFAWRPTAKRTLQRAAAVSNKTVSEFLLDSSLSAALDTLADRRVFQLDEVRWAGFMAALDMPPCDNPRLRKLLKTRAPWDPD